MAKESRAREKVIRTVMVLIASIVLFSANVNQTEAGTQDPVSLTGEWLGTWTSLNATQYNGTIEISMTQDGEKVFGTSLVGNTKCFPDRTFEGTLSGKYDNFVNLQLYADQTPISKLWGAISRTKNAISLVYNFDTDTSDCYGDVRTMFISKVQDYSKIQGFNFPGGKSRALPKGRVVWSSLGQ
ncbi:MAG: hypothetical protein F6K24_26485 [Okeania sp. SIO2D1]|nr:hypothetical protein [Okeania sp. SIO2D1]